jgi:predicted metal-dependent enzyme (double-stranded beta helix superfamily)
MTATIEKFAKDCHDILKAEPGPHGRQKIRAMLETLLRDPQFVEANVTDKTPDRHILYEDPELGFCILAHNYTNAKTSPPHDHGPSWAIYGQAKGETEMTDYQRIAEPANGQPGKAKALRTYKLTPGVAHVYNEKDLHSPRRDGPTRLIRLEGLNMDRIKRDKFEAV